MKIAFFGTPQIAAPCLTSIINSRHEVILAVTRPDRPVGRKQVITPPPVKEIALKNSIPVLQPEKAADPSFLYEYKKFTPDLNIIMAYGRILPDKLIYHPAHDSINIHASLLPKYRGAAPINAAIINGDDETGITYQFIEAKLDAGDIVHYEKILISPFDDAEILSTKVAELAGDTVVKVIDMIESGSFTRTKQDESRATFVRTLKKEDGKISFNENARVIHNKIRGLVPWPVAYCMLNGKKLKIFRASLAPDPGSMPAGTAAGTVKDRGFIVKTSDSALLIEEVQYEGGKRMNAYNFSLGHNGLKGSVLT